MKKILLVTLICLVLAGCVQKVYVPEYIEKEVYIPISMNIPELNCEFSGDPSQTVEKLIKCLKEQKMLLDTIRSENNSLLIDKKQYDMFKPKTQ